VDLIQARYGWTDQQLFSISGARFLQLADAAITAHNRDERSKLYTAAFQSWQVIEAVKAMLVEKSKPQKFGDYIKQLGLDEKDRITKEEKKKQIERSLKIAAEIKQLDDQARKGAV
jgi:hypothetical protein